MPSTLKTFVAGAAVGGVAAYLLDSNSGARRREELAAAARRRKHDVEGAAKGAQATAQGVVAKAQHAAGGGESAPPDDITLARKVETEIFRPADAPKGQVNVQALDGVVELRGQVDAPQVIEDLEQRTRRVTGVRDVRNLLHLPGQQPSNLGSSS
ncbi:MAG TPA: BON domain-containing protein [Solirubrobacteraceae bacterium]|jgi:osmotically-inducible protein OsmY|nr:BON domain-containing protein [Solirubrobacteraceae bacterium]